MLIDDETRFYRDLRRDLDVETMAGYFAEPLDRPSQFLILGEDITVREAKVPDAVAEMSVEQVDQLLLTLSRLHATYWGSPRLTDSGDLSRLQHPATGRFADFLRVDGFALIRMLLDLPHKQALLRTAGTDIDGMEASFWRLQNEVARQPITLLHGDPHPRNTYALRDGRTGVLDWRLVRRGSWSDDIGYALIAALPPEERRAYERELLDNYRGRLTDAGVVSVPDPDSMWLAYRQSPAWGFCMWAITPPDVFGRHCRSRDGSLRASILRSRHRRGTAILSGVITTKSGDAGPRAADRQELPHAQRARSTLTAPQPADGTPVSGGQAYLGTGSRGRPRMRSPTRFLMISDVPPAMVKQRLNR
ncbi:phosphotransferase [Mycobacterium sp. MUNTM1]